MNDIRELEQMAARMRMDCLQMIHDSNSGHPGGSLSATEILTVLYFHTLNIDVDNPKWPDRDRFVLSKGHAAPMVFAALANRGFFSKEEYKGFRQTGGNLQGTVSIHNPGGDMTVGSLGQYLSVAIGMAIAGRLDNKDYKVYAMLGDGELQEGQVWEALMFAPAMQLGNLVAILDNNHVQMCGKTDDILSLGDLSRKFEAFGWAVKRIDGHDIAQIMSALDSIPFSLTGQPTMIIADTVKGKGVSYMEGTAQWHGGAPDDEQLAQAFRELGGAL